MLTLKKFIEFDNIISEAFNLNEEFNWHHTETSAHNNTNIGGSKVHIHILKQKNDVNTVHAFSFKVNDSMDKKAGLAHGKDILSHVSKAFHDYSKKYVNKGDIITMTGEDKDKETQIRKNNIYSLFGKRLANHIGGEYKKRSMGSTSTLHFVYSR